MKLATSLVGWATRGSRERAEAPADQGVRPPRHFALLLAFLTAPLFAQTTQGLISGRMISTVTGQGIGGALVEYTSTSSTQGGTAPADKSGYYTLPLLSPGIYRVRVSAQGFQAQEVQELELPVAARIELDFRMRPLTDVWETGQFNSVFLPGQRTIVTFFGPDVDTSRSGSFEATKGRTGALESTISEVIDNTLLNTVPLEGRDVYTLLITQPGITSDAATGRGLGLSAIGQRPSASNFLLDGVENNNYLITGPLVTVAPEAIQEYRISTNNFSAEYGRTSGFLANAITRSGTDQYHGNLYFYIQNDVLNANSFQHNLNAGLILSQIKPFIPAAEFAKLPTRAPRTPSKQLQTGFVLTGPLIRNKLYASSSGEYFRSKSFQDPQIFDFPTQSFFGLSQPVRDSYQLLQKYAPPASIPTSSVLTGVTLIAPPVDLYRRVYIERLDYISPGGRSHLTGRVIINRLGNPTFIWTPYPDFVSALHHNTIAPAVTLTHNFRPGLTTEARVSYSDDDLYWNRPHPEVPTLAAGDANNGLIVSLPGSPAFYEYKNVNRSWELLDNVVWSRGRHLFTFGGGALLRRSGGYLTSGRDAQYLFGSILFFALDRPFSFSAPLDRDKLATLSAPQYDRTFRYRQFNMFAQDTWKLTSRLTLNYGLRWEIFGGPSNTGRIKDDLVVLGSGPDLATQLATATVAAPAAGSGDQKLFGTDYKDFAPRIGASYDLFGTGRTLLRGAYGIFYDRPFDNLWENLRSNNLLLLQAVLGPGGSGLQTHFLGPVATQVATLAPRTISSNFPDLTLIPFDLKNGYAHSYFAGVQHRFTNSFTLEVNASGSYGRRLITTDLVNRDFTTNAGRINPAISQDISYRAAQGYADYNGLTTVARYRTGRGFLQATYTWSHVIDNQSEPLLGDFFNLKFTDATSNQGPGGRAAFTKQFNPFIDRGNATFDQRHNFIVFSYWSLPSPLRGTRFSRTLGWLTDGWGMSEMAAFRSGFPYNLVAPTNAVRPLGVIANNRPNVLNPDAVFLTNPVEVAGGRRLLNAPNFTEPAISTLGTLGRNALSGPGFYNIALSVSKSFAVPRLGEGARLTFRADAYNVLNHANLGNPVTQLRDPNFGVAFFGRSGAGNGFPATSPLNETPRVVQLSLRMIF